MSTRQSSAEYRRYVAREMPSLAIHTRDLESARFERASMVAAIASKLCILHTIGLGAMNAAVRLRCGDYTFASRIGALSLTSSIHLVHLASRRTVAKRRCTLEATSLIWQEAGTQMSHHVTAKRARKTSAPRWFLVNSAARGSQMCW